MGRETINIHLLFQSGQLFMPTAIGLFSLNHLFPRSAQIKTEEQEKNLLNQFPGITKAQLQVAKNYSSPWLLGPELCPELISVIEHLYTPEQAEVVQYITPLRLKTSKQIAQESNRPEPEVRAILEEIEKFPSSLLVLNSEKGAKRYGIIPLGAGTFESVLIKTDFSHYTPWHQEFARRFEKLWSTGYISRYLEKPSHGVRYIPSYPTISNHPSALPSDRLPEVLERYDYIAVGICQCRVVAKFNDYVCQRPMETCITFGGLAKRLVEKGHSRKIDAQEALEIKFRAEEAGLATWLINYENKGMESNASCSCCGCCCHGLQTITKFNKPGLVAPPHFMPKIDPEKCTYCGKCQKQCPTNAHQVNEEEHSFDPLRCLGCGLCVRACPKQALEMEPVPDYKAPPQTRLQFLRAFLPPYLKIVRAEKKRRKKD